MDVSNGSSLTGNGVIIDGDIHPSPFPLSPFFAPVILPALEGGGADKFGSSFRLVER